MEKLVIGIVAPSSVVPQYEFSEGLKRLRAEKRIEVRVHPQCRKMELFFAGSDEDRAHAFLEMAMDPEIHVLWCARGGYGAYRLLPLLDQFTPQGRTPPRKLIVGYSDATLLLEYARSRWGWSALHGPMPGLLSFLEITE